MTLWTSAHQASLSFTIYQSWLKFTFMSIESVMLSNHLILCCPLLLLPSILPNIRVFSSELAVHIRWPKYWRFSFSISPFNEYSGLISFRIDWLAILAVRGILKSLFQHYNSKASILRCSAFFMGFPDGPADKESACNVGDLGSIPWLGRCAGERNGYPLQYSGLENSVNCIVHVVTKSQIWLSDFPVTFIFIYGPFLTSIHDYWKNYSFDYMDLCWQRDVSAL